MISIIIPTYNPNINRLQRTIDGLFNQNFANELWECIIIDNNSSQKFDDKISISENFRIAKEPKQGLTFARLKGFAESKGEIIVMVDDDNVLDKDYFRNVIDTFNKYPRLGAIGGNIEPEFETSPPDWTKEFWGKLAIRNLGNEAKMSVFGRKKINHYPAFSPVGAGMAIRKETLNKYISDNEAQSESISDRKGNNLSSSGDNEIVMYVLKSGFEIGFFPELKLTHLIPANRLTKAYLSRLNYGIMNSWTKFLLKHQLCSWKTIPKWTVPLRKFKSYFLQKAWTSEVNYIHWKGNCGTFDGLVKKN